MTSASVRVFLAFVVGLVAGTFAGTDALVSIIEPVGTLWINAIRMPVIPLLFALTVAGIAASRDTRAAGRVTLRALVIFVVLLAVTSAAATVLAPLLLGGMTLDPASTAALRASVVSSAADTQPMTLVGWLLSLVPVNPIGAAADGALLPLVIFALLYGLALTQVDENHRTQQVALFRGIAATLLRVIEWVLALAPLGVFALAFTLGARVGAPAAGAVVRYLAVTSGAVIVVMALLYVLMITVGGIPARSLVAALLPAQLIALSSRSSLAALPALIEGVHERLHLPERVTGVVLPLAASVFKINAGVTWVFGAVFVARLYDVPFGVDQLVIFSIATVLLAFTTPGIPSGGFFVQAPLYVAVGLPPEGLGVLIAVDLVLDMFKTAANVTGFAAAAVLAAPRDVALV